MFCLPSVATVRLRSKLLDRLGFSENWSAGKTLNATASLTFVMKQRPIPR